MDEPMGGIYATAGLDASSLSDGLGRTKAAIGEVEKEILELGRAFQAGGGDVAAFEERLDELIARKVLLSRAVHDAQDGAKSVVDSIPGLPSAFGSGGGIAGGKPGMGPEGLEAVRKAEESLPGGDSLAE